MSYFLDLDQQTMVAWGPHVRAVGWLHPAHPFTRGDVSPEFVARLVQFAKQSPTSAADLYFEGFGGFHTCEFCGNAHGTGNFGVPAGDLLYIAPEMIVHYVQEHAYCPPPEFVEAVLRSPLPGTEEYTRLTRPFHQIHKQALDEMLEGNSDA